MRKVSLGAASLAGLIVAAALVRAEDKADSKLPWNPCENAVAGEWACWLKEATGSLGPGKLAITTRVGSVLGAVVNLETQLRDLVAKKNGSNPKAFSRKEAP